MNSIVVGSLCCKYDQSMKIWYDKAKNNIGHFRVRDAIKLKRIASSIFLCGSNDESHYYAVAELLERWGCRWVMPGEFGEVVPKKKILTIGGLNIEQEANFEIRDYWISWLGSQEGHSDFRLRNRYNIFPRTYSCIAPAINSVYPHIKNFHESEENWSNFRDDISKIDWESEILISGLTDYFAEKYQNQNTGSIDLGAEFRGNEIEFDKRDSKYGIIDKYSRTFSISETYFYCMSEIAKRLQKRYPESKTKIFLWAYTDLIIPPQKKIEFSDNVYLIFINIERSYLQSMADADQEYAGEYRELISRWSAMVDGRVIIYDYDSPMTQWRDLPCNPLYIFERDNKYYSSKNIIGISSETRGVFATTVFHRYIRSKLMWNPDLKADKLLSDFCENFHGPYSDLIEKYWKFLADIWSESVTSEKTYWIIPIIYNDLAFKLLKRIVDNARKNAKKVNHNNPIYQKRFEFALLTFDMIDHCRNYLRSSCVDCDYESAIIHIDKLIKTRSKIESISSNLMPPLDSQKKCIYADASDFFLTIGEKEEIGRLNNLLDNGKKIITKLPKDCFFKEDSTDTGLVSGWAYKFPAKQGCKKISTTNFIQSHEGLDEFHGIGWYFMEFSLTKKQIENLRLLFPGILSECWLYLNGYLVEYRYWHDCWWLSVDQHKGKNDLWWDIYVTNHVIVGKNRLALRVKNHVRSGGMLRRPLLYRP